jgi:opacity protein-like surface antigen
VNKKNLFLICFSLFLSSKAYSQDMSDAVGDKNQSWYASASFATAIWSSDYWNERYYSADAVVSHQNQKFKDFSNYALGIGYRSDRIQTEFVYEDFKKVRWTAGQTVDGSGRVFDNGELHVESKNIMAQVSYDFFNHKNNQVFGLIGVGFSEHHVDTAYLMISGVRVDYASPNTTKNTSYRLGIGNRFRLTKNTAIETKLNYSDYGKVFNLHTTTNKESYSIKMQAIEAGISLKYYF